MWCGYRDLWTAADGSPRPGKHVFKVTVEPSLIWSVMGPSQIVQMTPTPLWCLIHLARRASRIGRKWSYLTNTGRTVPSGGVNSPAVTR